MSDARSAQKAREALEWVTRWKLHPTDILTTTELRLAELARDVLALTAERDGAEKAARQEAGQYMRQLDELREENARLQTEMCHCEKCGHVQAEPNWCHKCQHRTSCPEWAVKMLGEIDAARKETEDAEEAAEREAVTLRQALEAIANEAAKAVTEPRRFHENEDERQQALGTAVARARAALAAAGDTEAETT